MDETAICLPWDKNFILTPLGQTVVYEELRIYKRMRRYLACQYPLGQTLKNHPLLNGIAHYTTILLATTVHGLQLATLLV